MLLFSLLLLLFEIGSHYRLALCSQFFLCPFKGWNYRNVLSCQVNTFTFNEIMLCQEGLVQADFRLNNPLTLHLPSSGMTGMFHSLFLILSVFLILESVRFILMIKVAQEIATLYNLPDLVGSPVMLASTQESLSFSHLQCCCLLWIPRQQNHTGFSFCIATCNVGWQDG